jgi:hypothetical protein
VSATLLVGIFLSAWEHYTLFAVELLSFRLLSFAIILSDIFFPFFSLFEFLVVLLQFFVEFSPILCCCQLHRHLESCFCVYFLGIRAKATDLTH